jgi:hypothetical protein
MLFRVSIQRDTITARCAILLGVRSGRTLAGECVSRRRRAACAARFVGLLRKRFAEDLDAVWLYGPRVRGEAPQEESELQLTVLLRHSSRSDRVTALELLWQAALAEGATQSYFSIRIADRASPERRRAMDEFLAREVSSTGSLCSPAPGLRPAGLANRPRARRLPNPEYQKRATTARGGPGALSGGPL